MTQIEMLGLYDFYQELIYHVTTVYPYKIAQHRGNA